MLSTTRQILILDSGKLAQNQGADALMFTQTQIYRFSRDDRKID